MRRLAVLAALLLVLTGCASTDDPAAVTQAVDAVNDALAGTAPSVAKAQRAVEDRRADLEGTVLDDVEPRLPEPLRDSAGYDAAALESFLVTSQGPRFADAGKVGKAACPAADGLTEGMQVRCTLAVAGSPVPFTVTLTDVRSDAPKAVAEQSAVAVPTARVAALVAPGGGSTVSCGKGDLLVAKVGATVSCDLESGPQVKPFRVTVKDATGVLTIG